MLGRHCAWITKPHGNISQSPFLLANVGGALVFSCNYDYKLLSLSNHLPNFYKEIISRLQNIIASTPQSKNDVLAQIIWNNKFLTVDKKSVYFPCWHRAGIVKIPDLFDEEKNCFLSFESLCGKFQASFNFIHYCSLLSSIPSFF